MDQIKRPLLSICIPTYNRAYMIKECLKNLCPLLDKYPIEIFISDNCSTDDTASVLRYFKELYPIKYFIQNENKGPDKNFEFVLKHASGDYRWLMGDGCYITDEAIELLLFELKKEYSIIIANDLDKQRLISSSKITYTDPQKLLTEIGWHMTWMSVLIYSRKIIQELNFERYYNTNFIQTGIIFEYLAYKNVEVLVLPSVGVVNIPLPKHNTWHNEAFLVFCKRWYLFVMSLPPYYSYESKIKCIRDHSIKSQFFGIRNLCVLRMKNYFNPKILREYKFFIYQVIPENRFVIKIIAMIPRWLLHKIKNGYINLKK